MPAVTGTRGNKVSFEVQGVAEVQKMLMSKNIILKGTTGAILLRSAAYTKEEIQESIAGNRVETKSVDTGEFLNSIGIGTKRSDEIEIKSDVPQAKYMEYGTTKIRPRRHFRNTKARVEPKIIEDAAKMIKAAM